MSNACKSPRTRMAYAQSGNTTLPDFSYTFDAASNITRKKFEHRTGTPSEDYLYDTLDRLTRTDFGQRTSTPYESFVYDDLGNHLTQNDNGTEIAGLFNAVNEQTKRGGADVLYDKKGNLTKDDDGQVYFYDRQNLLTRVEKPANTLVASYSYDAFNRRIEKDVNGGDVTRFYWTDDWRLLEETDDAGTPAMQRYYVWGNYIDELLMFRDVVGTGGSANADYFACRHHNYNIVTLLNSTGAVVERDDYNPYGERIVLNTDYTEDASGGDCLSDFGLTIGHQGLMHDEESGLIYNRGRMLHTGLGRWLQREPLRYVNGMSLYQYVRSRPTFFVDWNGLQAGMPGNLETMPGLYNPDPANMCTVAYPNGHGSSPAYPRNWLVEGNCIRCHDPALPDFGNWDPFIGVEVGIGPIGGGISQVNCCRDGCEIRMSFRKVCYGFILGASASTGRVWLNQNGCDRKAYEGWFLEIGASAFIFGAGADFGFDDSTGNDPLIPHWMPDLTQPSCTNEVGAGLSVGAKVKAAWCRYTFISESKVGPCGH